MIEAYVLIQTDIGKPSQVAAEVRKIHGVATAVDVAGPYDAIARVGADDVEFSREAGRHQDPGRGGSGPYPDLPGGSSLGTGWVRTGWPPTCATHTIRPLVGW